MKKKLCSLMIALIVLSVSALTPLFASAEIPALEPTVFFRDFENEAYIVGDGYTDEEFETMTGVPMQLKTRSATEPTISIIEEEDGNKLFRIVTNVNRDEVDSIYVLGSPLSVGKLEASYEVSFDADGAGAWHCFVAYNASSVMSNTLKYSGSWGKSDAAAVGEVKATPALNAKGRYSLRAVFSRTSADEAWKIEVYDDVGDSPMLVYEGKTAADFGAISKIQPIRLYASDPGWKANYDNYMVKVTPIPQVVDGYDGCDGAAPDSASMTIRFNGALPDPDDEITIVKADDPELKIDADVTYNAETGDLTIAPKSFLDYDTDYKLVFKNGGVADHTFTTAKSSITMEAPTFSYTPAGENGAIPQEGTFNATCSFSITNFNTATTWRYFDVIIVARNEAGVAIKTETFNKNIRKASSASGRTATITATLEGLDATKVKKVEAFIWEKVDGVGYVKISIG